MDLARQQFESTVSPRRAGSLLCLAHRRAELRIRHHGLQDQPVLGAGACGSATKSGSCGRGLSSRDLTGTAPTRDDRIAAEAADWRGRTLRRGANKGKPRLDAFRAVTGYPDITKEERDALEGATT